MIKDTGRINDSVVKGKRHSWFCVVFAALPDGSLEEPLALSRMPHRTRLALEPLGAVAAPAPLGPRRPLEAGQPARSGLTFPPVRPRLSRRTRCTQTAWNSSWTRRSNISRLASHSHLSNRSPGTLLALGAPPAALALRSRQAWLAGRTL